MTLTDLLDRFPDVEQDTDGWLAHCPAHSDSRQSLRLTVSDTGKVLLKCRAGCPTQSVLDALGLTMRDLASMEPGEVSLARVATSQDTPASPREVAALAVKLDGYAAALLHSHAADAATDYAAARFGVTESDAERLGLGFADDLGGGPRLVVPFRDRDGVARGYQARAIDPAASVRWLGPKSPDGASWARVGWFPGTTGFDEVLIAEGPGDALTGACALGIDTIGIRGAGLAANPSVVADIVALLGGREAVIAGDGDPAGRRFTSTLAEALTAHDVPVKALALPDGVDLSDWRAQDPARFYTFAHRAIAAAPLLKSRTAALLAWDEERYSLTDLGGARYLRDYLESIGSGVRFTDEAGFYLLQDGVWVHDELQTVRTHAQSVADLVRSLAREASNAAQRVTDEDAVSERAKKRAARLNRYAAHVQTTRGLDSMLRELQAVSGVPASLADFDRHPDLLACRNGVVNLRTGDLLPHDPHLLLTRRVQYDYDPAATAPRWDRFLDEVFRDHADLPGFMQRLIGYGITGHTSEECFAVLWGNGQNGKSKFTDTLTEVFRELTTTTPFSTFEERQSGGIPNDLAALKGARLVMAAEGEQGRPMAEAVLKRVTGRDMIAARFMRKEFFEFRPTFLLLLATNFKPAFKGQDEGLWRRVKLIPWSRYFTPDERDPHLGEKLLAEAPGILAWAVRGAVAWYASGLGDPGIVKASTKEYRQTSDALAGFLPGVFILDPKAEGRVDGQILFDRYREWADEENLPQREIWTRRTFYGALEERGLNKRSTKRGVAFEGVRRARQTDADPDEATPRAEPAPLALSAPVSPSDGIPRLSGADLDNLK